MAKTNPTSNPMCVISIMFVPDNDAQVLSAKQKITDATAELSEVVIDLRLRSSRPERLPPESINADR